MLSDIPFGEEQGTNFLAGIYRVNTSPERIHFYRNEFVLRTKLRNLLHGHGQGQEQRKSKIGFSM